MVDPISGADLAAVEALLEAGFAGRVQVRLGEVVDVLALPGLVSRADGQVTGYVAYRVGDGEATGWVTARRRSPHSSSPRGSGTPGRAPRSSRPSPASRATRGRGGSGW